MGIFHHKKPHLSMSKIRTEIRHLIFHYKDITFQISLSLKPIFTFENVRENVKTPVLKII